MARDENMLILKMLQEGTITAEQAAELLSALDASEARAAAPPAPAAPQVAGVPPVPPMPPVPPVPPVEVNDVAAGAEPHGEVFARARERIAAARERVAGVQEKLNAAEEKISKAEGEGAHNPWESLAEALKDVPGAKAVSEALRDPGRLAANARRQARRMARQLRSSLSDLNLDIHLNLAETVQGEPTLSAPREATAAIPPGGMLRVRNTLGDIEATGADVPEARVAGVLKIWAADKAAAEALAQQVTLNVEHGADGPTISVQHPPRTRRVSLDLKVFVPQSGAKVSLLSPSGNVSVRGVKGGVVLATQSGDAKAAEIVGDVAAETASGDVAIEGVTGNIQASSASGDIQAIRLTGQNVKALSQSGDISLKEATVPSVNIETVSGDAEVKKVSGRSLRVRAVSGDTSADEVSFEEEVHLDTVSGCISYVPRGPLTAGSVTLATVSGDVDIKLPKETNATIEVSTKGGDVTGKFKGQDGTEKTLNATGMTSLSETIGTGAGARLTLSSVSGDLCIKQDSATIEMS